MLENSQRFVALAGIYKNCAAFLQLLLQIFTFDYVNINMINNK
ncbi:hypothetical protein HMPREF3208_00278 [Gardnerella vaginalis]|uniref:Uncharacterized protein n=1 Tax=Gardnerella vaginalis TaxID=2702 RepID=A0A133P1T0_GARVA|nr:hypothetical protein HMPREF3208_00278 [Gardnerella vaginalis]